MKNIFKKYQHPNRTWKKFRSSKQLLQTQNTEARYCWGQALAPQLLPFAATVREINFCFDNDQKPTTKENVHKALNKTGKLRQYNSCKVNIITWNTPELANDSLTAILQKLVASYHYQAYRFLRLQVQAALKRRCSYSGGMQ